MLDLEGLEEIETDQWPKMMARIGEALRRAAIEGHAAQISDNRYSIIHDIAKSPEHLKATIEAIIKDIAPPDKNIEIITKTLRTDLDKLSTQEAARGLFYIITEFEKEGWDTDIESLSAGLANVNNDTNKAEEFKRIVEKLDFEMRFQPVVDLETKEAHHYEALSRFPRGEAREWVMFGEDTGMAPAFDLAAVQKVMNFIHYKAGVTRTRFAINLSLKSIEGQKFYKKLNEILAKRDFAKRILFEFTGSGHIENIKKTLAFIQALQKAGYEIGLDDFEANPKSFELLQKLKPDYVSIHAKYSRRFLQSHKDETAIRDINKHCRENNIITIAKHIENPEQAEALRELGINYGQGFLFGKGETKPSYVPKK